MKHSDVIRSGFAETGLNLQDAARVGGDHGPGAAAQYVPHFAVLQLLRHVDREVPVAHARRLDDAARGGDSDSVSLVVVPGVNHLLQPATTGEVAEYQALTGKGVSPSVVSAVVTWLQATLPERGK
jgi:hypothetical protein